MLLLHNSIIKKRIIFSFLLILAIGFLFAFFYEDKGVVPTLYPDYTEFKIKPLNDQNLVQNLNSDKTIYDNFSAPGAKKTMNVNFLPAPEDPLEVSPFEVDSNIFTIMTSQNNEKLYASISEKETRGNSIWEGIDENNSKQNEDSIHLKGNILKVTSISDQNLRIRTQGSRKSEAKFFLQLFYSRSEAEALNSWNQIKANNKKPLRNVKHRIFKQKKGTAFFYELLVGPIESFNEAKHLCTKLKLEKHKCLIINK